MCTATSVAMHLTRWVTTMSDLHLAVALDGAGWHPAAWREADARPGELFTARYWTDLVQQAERGLLDLVTIEDGFSQQIDHHQAAGDRTDRVRGRLDANLVAARVAPTTSRIGLLPTVVAPHTEPFHVSKAIATLDFVSTGRAGVRVRSSVSADEYGNVGRRPAPELPSEGVPASLTRALFGEVEDYIEVLRRLWDSWEDDAEIRDVATGRFVDREKLHYIDFEGAQFSVRGPSITPRPPQGQPLVSLLVHQKAGYELLARSADLGFVTPTDAADAHNISTAVRAATAQAGRTAGEVNILGDVVVFLDETYAAASARKERLDVRDGDELRSDATIFVGAPAELADLILDWHAAGLDGVRLRPGALPHDLTQITDALVPELQRRGAFRRAYDATTLRGHFGLTRPANRYVA